MNVAIIDTGIANFGSIGTPSIARTPEDIEAASHLILPGVGSFDVAMRTIEQRRLRDVLQRKALVEKTPTLGICLGMQLLGASSEEGKIAGLGWLKGSTVKIVSADLKVPHIGWNKVQWDRQMPLFVGIEPGARFYFVHSYHYKTEKPDEIVANVEYGDRLAAVIQHDNIVGAQFHPEKSRAGGLQLLRNFLQMTR